MANITIVSGGNIAIGSFHGGDENVERYILSDGTIVECRNGRWFVGDDSVESNHPKVIEALAQAKNMSDLEIDIKAEVAEKLRRAGITPK